MKTFDRNQVIAQMDGEPGTVLVDVLPEGMFRKYHIPGAINVPVDDADFDANIQAAVPDKAQPVIVYCYDADCDASPQAARRMEELGYREVIDYANGKEDWRKAGLEVAS